MKLLRLTLAAPRSSTASSSSRSTTPAPISLIPEHAIYPTRLNPDTVRTAAALGAATLGVFICIAQHHFTLSLADPHSFVIMTHHRCGMMLVAASIWLVVEAAHLALRSWPTSSRQKLSFQ